MDFQSRYAFNPKTDLLGKGGFSKVYKANDTLLDRTVALKFFTSNGFEKYQVLNEIKKVIKFEHPNLCKYYDVAVINTTNILGEAETIEVGIMEYLDAGEFKKYLQNNPQHIDKLLIDVLRGLSYLHRKGIVHRDLKPQNILVKMEDDEPVAKITDFGISKLLGAEDSSASALIGTIEYMAPEQFNPKRYGIGGRITTNLDLWSFGLLVYEAIEQKPLFGSRSKGVSAEQIMTNILNDSYQQKTKSLPSKYRAIVDKCLIKNAAERVQGAIDLIPMFSQEGIALPMRPVNVASGEHRDISGEVEPVKEDLADPLSGEMPVYSASANGEGSSALDPPEDEPETMFLSMKAEESEAKDAASKASKQTGVPDGDVSENLTKVLQQDEDDDIETKVIRPKTTRSISQPVEATRQDKIDTPFKSEAEQTVPASEKANQDPRDKKKKRKLAWYVLGLLILITGFFMFKKSSRVSDNMTVQNSKPAQRPAPGNEVPRPRLAVLNMAQIAGGRFTMGSGNGEDSRFNPAHAVSISDFSLAKYEVTVDEFRKFIQATGYITTAEKEGSSAVYINSSWDPKPKVNWRYDESGNLLDINRKNVPVVHVSWYDANEYCKWLSDTTGRHFRLPTDAEWEYAAKAKQGRYKYSGSDDLARVAWFGDNSGYRVHPVGQKQPNELNIYDMTGNVMEWCNDWYLRDYYKASATGDPTGPGSGKDKVVRGGSWYLSDTYWFNNSYRDGFRPETTGGQLGFRICEAN